MPKRGRERGAARGRAELPDSLLGDELQGMLDRLYPRLRSTRDALAAELAGVDAALATLERWSKAEANASNGRPASRAPRARARSRASDESKKPTLGALVLETLAARGPLPLYVLSTSIATQHGVSVVALPRVLADLRKRGRIEVHGTRGSYKYAVASWSRR